jgi:hypothetical protein
MILHTMRDTEVYNEIINDYENVLKKVKHLFPIVLRRYRKKLSHTFIPFEYESPMKNKWVLFLSVFTSENISFIPVVYSLDGGFNTWMYSNNHLGGYDSKGKIVHYTSHFFDRYNERFLELDYVVRRKKILIEFFKRNSCGISNNFRGNEIFTKIEDGISLGDMSSYDNFDMFHYRTYIEEDMLFDEQCDTYDKTFETYKDYRQYIIDTFENPTIS